MAYSQVEATDTLDAGRVKINATFRGTSVIDPSSGAKSLQVHQNAVGPSANDMPIEIINIGYTGHGATDEIHQNVTGLVRINGRLDMVRNMVWDQANAKWLTPLQGATAFGSAAVELGGEAVILHATPPGVDISDVPHEILLAKSTGTDGEANNTVSTGYFTQSKACIFARFNSTAYNPADTANCWNQVAGTDPLLWLSAAQVKNTENEFARLEGNGSGVYGGLFFAQSNGTLGGRTAVTTGAVMGAIAFKGHDGTDFETCAQIAAVSRGTIASNQVAMDLRFSVSATNSASLSTRMEIKYNGTVNIANSQLRGNYPSSFTTIPLYSAFTAPALDNSTAWQIQPASLSTGGFLATGFTIPTNTAIAFIFRGIQGHTSPTAANTVFIASKSDGSLGFVALAATEIAYEFRTNTTVLSTMLGSGNIGHLVAVPTAVVHIAASNTTRASLCLNPGAAPTSPINGDIWIDSTAHTMHVRINGVTKTFTLT